MGYREKIQSMRAELRVMNKLMPPVAAGFAELSKAAKEGPALSVKEKEYVALGIAISQRCEPCINFHVEALMKAGATREDLGDVLGMCIQMGGGPALMYAAHALAAWDELAAPAG
ncbi:carboxymuconolactone decarboxylase family protein [Rhodobacter sp. SGA-6-6]|uniref:carboxymuconolactone decarboxylase family protein n=1 Tax=Rhodobacter sp. SGA-6-6 TaxID=2710882 RepID=UPI0013EDEF0E|nr:carboxymuconolactone decarboxylase family protein [Rhodobacter sp. SGA-6-6]NGM44019.1 carboxymuconolactone decarboxylase family protein [Rhodobacter sp. SGA-6-6]